MMKDEEDGWAATALNEIVGTGLLLAAVLVLGNNFFAPERFDFSAIPATGWAGMVASGLIYAAVMYPTYRSYTYLEAAEVRILSQLINPWTIFLGIVLFSEAISFSNGIGIALIVAGIAVATVFNGKRKLSPTGIELVLITVALTGLASAADKLASPYFPPLVYAILPFGMPAIFASAIVLRRKKGVKKFAAYASKSWKISSMIGGTNILAYFGVLMAFRLLPLSVASPIIGTNVVFSVLAGMWLLGEKENWERKALGAALALVGIAVLSM